jgi:mitochondrial import inner membrane translocase subunit TIM44
MLVARRAPAHGVKQYVAANFASTSAISQHGRTAAYRRLNTLSSLRRPSQTTQFLRYSLQSQSRYDAPPQFSVLARSLHISIPRYQQPQPKEEVKDPPRPEDTEQKASEGESSEQKTEDSKEEGKEKGKDSDAPPPPHGSKSPWQVFTDTLRTEFKASQEWNESTKQLGGRVQAFTESEGVRRAREASEAATSGAGKVLKGTGKAIGQTASWTWNTSAVQGLRAGVNATGRGIEAATRPVRETKTFKDISDAMDDGSSSRYGGWIEKEERLRRREARELKEIKFGKRPEKLEEDPK